MKPFPFDYESPKDVSDVVALLSDRKDAKVIAGGQSLGPMLNFRAASPSLLVDVSRIEALRSVEEDDASITVGAAVRHAEFEDGKVASPITGIFPRIAAGIAYRAVRNRGTIGGSLAHADPAGDWPAVMYALDAKVKLRSTSSIREVSLSDFIVGPLETSLAENEIIEAVVIPKLSKSARYGRYKINKKPGDFAEATAIIIEDQERDVARIVISGARRSPTLLEKSSTAVKKLESSRFADFEREAKAELNGFGLGAYELRLFGASAIRATREMIAS